MIIKPFRNWTLKYYTRNYEGIDDNSFGGIISPDSETVKHYLNQT